MNTPSSVQIVSGYQPGLIARITDMHVADTQGFSEIHLWAFRGLEAARHLYESNGFTCIPEYPGDQWGSTVMEQQFVRRHP